MVSTVMQMLGLALSSIGFLGIMLICALPWWVFRSSIIPEGSHGLWSSCFQTRCVNHPPYMPMPLGVETARVLVIIAILLGVFGIVLGVVGRKYTNEDQGRKRKVTFVGGILFIIAGLMVLSSVSNFNQILNHIMAQKDILSQFSDGLNDPELRIESGASLYVGWGASGLLILGGVLMCSSCFPLDETNHSVRYRADPLGERFRYEEDQAGEEMGLGSKSSGS